MGVFEGKSPGEKYKLIAAIVLGSLAIISLLYTFGGSLIGGSTKTSNTASASATPTASVNASQNNATQISAPIEEEIYSDYLVTPIFYAGGIDPGPIGGRNIFAFYEPPGPTPIPPFVPKPSVSVEPIDPTFTPVPPPTPHPINLAFINPQSTYAGSKGFLIEANGGEFTPESKIVFNGTSLQTTFVSEQKLTASVPAAFIQNAGFGQVRVDNFDGEKFSGQISFNIQAPPKPTFEYVGMIARKHYNNDTAYFELKGKDNPIGKRLNDVVDSRFRLVSISEQEVEFVDTRLGFRHKLAMKRPDPSAVSDPRFGPNRRNNRRNNRNNRRNNRIRSNPTRRTTKKNSNCVPGIPCDIPRATPRPPRRIPTKPIPNEKKEP